MNTLPAALDVMAAAAEPEQLLPARSLMAFTLMFHIIFVPIGVALPTIMLIANFKGLKRNEALITVVPAIVLLYFLDQRGHLEEEPTTWTS